MVLLDERQENKDIYEYQEDEQELEQAQDLAEEEEQEITEKAFEESFENINENKDIVDILHKSEVEELEQVEEQEKDLQIETNEDIILDQQPAQPNSTFFLTDESENKEHLDLEIEQTIDDVVIDDNIDNSISNTNTNFEEYIEENAQDQVEETSETNNLQYNNEEEDEDKYDTYQEQDQEIDSQNIENKSEAELEQEQQKEQEMDPNDRNAMSGLLDFEPVQSNTNSYQEIERQEVQQEVHQEAEQTMPESHNLIEQLEPAEQEMPMPNQSLNETITQEELSNNINENFPSDPFSNASDMALSEPLVQVREQEEEIPEMPEPPTNQFTDFSAEPTSFPPEEKYPEVTNDLIEVQEQEPAEAENHHYQMTQVDTQHELSRSASSASSQGGEGHDLLERIVEDIEEKIEDVVHDAKVSAGWFMRGFGGRLELFKSREMNEIVGKY